MGYTLDDAGNRLTETATGVPLPGTTTYTYDDTDRLIAASYPDTSTAAWGYDPVGNRTSAMANGTTTHAAYDAANRLCWDGGATAGVCATPTTGAATYTHDSAGNRTSRVAGGVTTAYTYDANNMLKTVASGGSTTATYTYDGDGYRTKKVVGATTTVYAWDRLGLGGLGTVVAAGTAEFVHGPAGLQQRTVGAGSDYAHGDGLGSVRLVTNASGAASGSATYEPWGAPRSGSASLGGFGFTGELTDAETGLVYLRARYLDPASGRFTTEDPLGMGGGSTNFYAYAGHNPTGYTDPSGLLPGPVTGCLIGGATSGFIGGFALGLPGAVGGALIGCGVGAIVGGLMLPSNSGGSTPPAVTPTATATPSRVATSFGAGNGQITIARGVTSQDEKDAAALLERIGYRGTLRLPGNQRDPDGDSSDLVLECVGGIMTNYDIYTPETGTSGRNIYSNGIQVKNDQARGIVVDLRYSNVPLEAITGPGNIFDTLGNDAPNLVQVIFINSATGQVIAIHTKPGAR